jgi:hypothetical protein
LSLSIFAMANLKPCFNCGILARANRRNEQYTPAGDTWIYVSPMSLERTCMHLLNFHMEVNQSGPAIFHKRSIYADNFLNCAFTSHLSCSVHYVNTYIFHSVSATFRRI